LLSLVIPNLSDENDVLTLFPASALGCVLAGGAALARAASRETEESLLESVSFRIRGMSSGVRHWLMVGHDAWQPVNRIVLYNKLWRSLSRRTRLPAGPRSEEFLISSERGVMFFGFIECQDIVAKDVLSLVRVERACTLIATWGPDPTDELRSIARSGWELPAAGPPLAILKAACRMDLGVYASVGWFDDIVRGTVFIARPRWIEAAFPSAREN